MTNLVVVVVYVDEKKDYILQPPQPFKNPNF